MTDLRDYAGSAVAGLVAVVAGLLGWRGVARVGADNARDRRESRFEDNLQKRYEEAVEQNSRLREELAARKTDGRELEIKLADARRRIRALVEMLTPAEREHAERWLSPSVFTQFDDEPQPPRRK